jgi:hypothetical protein
MMFSNPVPPFARARDERRHRRNAQGRQITVAFLNPSSGKAVNLSLNGFAEALDRFV